MVQAATTHNVGKSPIGRESVRATATTESTVSLLRSSQHTKPATKARENANTATTSQKSSKTNMAQSSLEFKELNR